MHLEEAIRIERRLDGKGYRNFYIFKCKTCLKEMSKSKHDALKAVGFCINCLSMKLHLKKDDVSSIKQCKKCKQHLTIDNFHQRTDNKSKHYRGNCKKCHSLAVQFNINKTDYDVLFQKQNGLCAICELPETSPFNGKPRNLAVDHCHKTGKIRGLLCSKCNQGLGLFKEKVKSFQKAMEYLNEYNQN